MKINKKKLKNQRLIIERKINPWKKLRAERRPPSGWLKAVRGALGINTRQLAKKCGVQHSSILKIEKSEVQGKASIESLKKIASAMNCQLVYAIVPKIGYNSLEKIIDHQAEILAHKLIKKADHTMQLEAQGTSSREIKNQIKKLAKELKDKMDSRIWEKSLKQKKSK
ncbi:MAG: mobile mystery protein A [Bdellovibrionales bacterium]|nr:mobile mystery protein A [Bdellovibrionales bacterium]